MIRSSGMCYATTHFYTLPSIVTYQTFSKDNNLQYIILKLLHITNSIIKLYLFNTSYLPYDRQKWYPVQQEQWKGQQI
jgi:hypothetical protein